MPLLSVKILPEPDVGEELETGRGKGAYHPCRGLFSAAVSENDQPGDCSGVLKGEETFI